MVAHVKFYGLNTSVCDRNTFTLEFEVNHSHHLFLFALKVKLKLMLASMDKMVSEKFLKEKLNNDNKESEK